MVEKTCRAIDLNWDAIQAAPISSQATGVLAAIVFAGVILLFQSPPTSNRYQRYWTRALILLLYVFFGFMVTTFLYVIEGGESSCQRASLEDAFATMLLVTAAVAMLLALCWLVAVYVADQPERPVKWVKAFTALLTLTAWVYLEVSVLDTADALNEKGIPWVHCTIVVLGSITAIFGVVARCCSRLHRFLRRNDVRLFTITLYASLAAAAIALIGFASVTALDRKPSDFVPWWPWQLLITAAVTILIGFYLANLAIIKSVAAKSAAV